VKNVIIFSWVLFFFTGCFDKKTVNEKVYYQQLYRPFSHVQETFDSIKEKSSFQFDEEPLNQNEKDTLIKVLKEYNKEFIITTGNEIFVSILTVPSIYEMYILDAELKKRISQ
jgi:hypothetical protein